MKQLFSKQEIMARLKEKPSDKKIGLDAALFIASNALFYKTDRYGNDYGQHYIRVAFDRTFSKTKRIIGILHDVVEDSDWTLDDLREIGFMNASSTALTA